MAPIDTKYINIQSPNQGSKTQTMAQIDMIWYIIIQSPNQGYESASGIILGVTLSSNTRNSDVAEGCYLHRVRDYYGYGLNQWKMMLQCNAYSHWLSIYPEWSMELCHLTMNSKSSLHCTHYKVNTGSSEEILIVNQLQGSSWVWHSVPVFTFRCCWRFSFW